MVRYVISVPFTYTGVILRDSHGVAQVRFVTGSKILRILKAKSLAPAIPEDLYHLVKKAVSIRRHLERNRKVRGGPETLRLRSGSECLLSYRSVVLWSLNSFPIIL